MTTHDEQTNTASTSTADVAPSCTARIFERGKGTIDGTNRTIGCGQRSFVGDHHDRRATCARGTAGHGRRILERPDRTVGNGDRVFDRWDRTVVRQIAFRRRRPSTAALALERCPGGFRRRPQKVRPGGRRPRGRGRRTAHDRVLRGAIAARGAVGSRRGGLHGGPSSLAKALPRVLPAAALGLKRLQTEAPCCGRLAFGSVRLVLHCDEVILRRRGGAFGCPAVDVGGLHRATLTSSRFTRTNLTNTWSGCCCA